MHMLEEISPDCVTHTLSRDNAIMVDAMALLQSLTKIPKTFGELAAQVLLQLLSLAKFYKSSRIDFVADQYPEHSIKANERSRRAAQGSTLVTIYGKNQENSCSVEEVPQQRQKQRSSHFVPYRLLERLTAVRGFDGTDFVRYACA